MLCFWPFHLKFQQDYQLLCEDGTHSDIKDFKSCHLLQEPSHSLVVSSKIRSGVDVDVPMELVEVLLVAQVYTWFSFSTVEHL